MLDGRDGLNGLNESNGICELGRDLKAPNMG